MVLYVQKTTYMYKWVSIKKRKAKQSRRQEDSGWLCCCCCVLLCLRSKPFRDFREVSCIHCRSRAYNVRRNKARVNKAHAAFPRLINCLTMVGLSFVTVMVIRIGSLEFCRFIIGMLSSSDTLEGNKFHQGFVSSSVNVKEPDTPNDERNQHDTS